MNRARLAYAAIALLVAAYGLVVYVLPARGLTFFHEDWEVLYRFAHTPWPERWLAPINDHWIPLFLAFYELEWRVLGEEHTLYLVATVGLHAVAVFLLALVLEARCPSRRAAALAAAAFGFTGSFREVFWFSQEGTIPLCFVICCAGLVAAARFRESGGALALSIVGGSVIAAPLVLGSGLALGPALLLEVATFEKGPRRTRAALVVLAGIALVGLGYAIQAHVVMPPRREGDYLVATRWAVDLVGSGVVGGVFMRPPMLPPSQGALLAALYAVAVAFAFRFRRAPVVVSQAHLFLLVALVAVARWRWTPPTTSRYGYMLGLGWTTPLALLFALALGSTRKGLVLVCSFVLVVGFALGHARSVAADRNEYSPETRRSGVEALRRLRLLVGRTPGPLYDVTLPHNLAFPSTRACAVLSVIAPETTTVFTQARFPESEAPYRTDPLLRPLVDLPEERGPWK